MKKNYPILVSILLLTGHLVLAQPTQPANPAAGNEANCAVANAAGVPFDQCAAGAVFFVSDFQGGVYNRGNNGNNLGAGAIWRFANIGTSGGVTVNAEVTVNSLFQATLTNMDDNAATDQAGVSVANFFGPVIQPDLSLNAADRRGYVQFTVSFFQGVNNFTTPISLGGLNFVSYDADGNYNTSGTPSQSWFRETRVALAYTAGSPTILANSNSELVAYNYPDVTGPAATSWRGFAGGVYERAGISRCAEVASSFRYGTGANARSSITFRFGYDFKAGTGYNVGQPGRQYGARFGCYNFPNQTTLPLHLISFNAAYRNQQTLLNWSAENEQNFDHFEIERSTDGINFSDVGMKAATGNANRTNYDLTDDLSAETGNAFYYRLKMVDKDGRFSYSQVVLVKKDSKSIKGVLINPNPVVSGIATVKMTASGKAVVELRIIDLSGRVLLKQTQNVYEGNNSITLNVQKLQPGIYTLQLADGNEITATKFSVAR
jgi:hypothetical protein